MSSSTGSASLGRELAARGRGGEQKRPRRARSRIQKPDAVELLVSASAGHTRGVRTEPTAESAHRFRRPTLRLARTASGARVRTRRGSPCTFQPCPGRQTRACALDKPRSEPRTPIRPLSRTGTRPDGALPERPRGSPWREQARRSAPSCRRPSRLARSARCAEWSARSPAARCVRRSETAALGACCPRLGYRSASTHPVSARPGGFRLLRQRWPAQARSRRVPTFSS